LGNRRQDMSQTEPYFREAGSGPGVVCLHSNASSSAQWRGLIDLLSIDHHVLAPDLYGAGRSVDWHSDREIALLDEVRFIEPVLAKAGESFSLVGHSYGQSPPVGSVEGIQDAVRLASAALDAGDGEAAAEYFIDFWMGEGTWKATPAARRGPIAESVVNVRRWRHALFTEPTLASAFGALEMPILYMVGGESPESARAVGRALSPILPNVKVVEVQGWGHMAPITHAAAVNAQIAAFVREA
jgi:pimeloyl-ACP methyl ester carboxylesterase